MDNYERPLPDETKCVICEIRDVQPYTQFCEPCDLDLAEHQKNLSQRPQVALRLVK